MPREAQRPVAWSPEVSPATSRLPAGGSLQQRAGACSIDRRREVEPLCRAAAQFAEEAELLRRFDPLGDDLRSQVARQRKDGADQLRGLAARGAAGEER